MSRTTAPLLSFGASGQIGKTQVYASWKGRAYARRYVIPANPNSVSQQATRNPFKWLQNVYKYLPGNVVDGWELYAKNSQITSRNAFTKINLSALIGETTLANFIFSPSASGGLIAAGITVTPAATQLTVALDEPSLPTGWTISQAYAAAIEAQNPTSGVLYTVTSAVDAATPFAPVITGLLAATNYVVGGWFQFTKPDGSFAYGQALMDVGTTP